jgi:hypothetical protein
MVEGEKPGEVNERYAIDVFTSEVTQHRRGRYGINLPRETASHVYTECLRRARVLGPDKCNSNLMTVLQFAPFSSLVQPAFWHDLTSLKVDVLKLSDDSVPINASYALGKSIKDRETGKEIALGCNLTVGGGSFNKDSFQYASHFGFSFQFDGSHIATDYPQILSTLPESSRISTP